jgi:hypothetical protein
MEAVAPVAHVPAFSWTGFYLGGELGWIQTDPKYTTGALLGAPFVVTSGSDKNGLTYAILAGYNYQVGQLVVGVEADFQGWTVGEIRYTAVTGDFLSARSKWGGSATLPIVFCSMWRVAPRSSRTRPQSPLPGSQLAAMTRAWVGRRELVSYRFTSEEDGKRLRRYWTTACQDCALKSQCTTGPERRIPRWEHEHLLEAVQQRLDANSQAMRLRRETVEHPFGTMKARMGATHFLTKTLPKVAAEMALSVLAYDLTRVMNIVGTKPLMAAIAA